MLDSATLTAIKEADTFNQFVRTLAGLDWRQISTSQYASFAKKLRSLNYGPDVKLAICSNFTLDLLPAYVSVLAAKENLALQCYVSRYNQYYQELLEQESGFRRFNPDIVFLALSITNLFPDAHTNFVSYTTGAKKELKQQIVSGLMEWTQLALSRLKSTILMANFASPHYRGLGVADLKQEYGESEFWLEVNLELLRECKKEQRLHLIDVEKVTSSVGKEYVFDPKMKYLAGMEWSERFFPALADELVRYIKALKGLTKKCLIIDLDGTLWGGVLGEEGPLGVKVGKGDPESEAYWDFQLRLKRLKERGILLAICSKNNLGDVQEMFDKRPDMPLKLSDFSEMEINWEPKSTNIQKLCSRLNIGLNSVIFIDDSPAECSLIEAALPEVCCICLPQSVAEYPLLLDRMNDFEKVQVIEDDAVKTDQYRENKQREELKQHIGDLRDYLHNLQTKIIIRNATQADLPRVHQLFTKTNQFNVTTIRYTPGEIEELIHNNQFVLTLVSAKDRFGDLGIIGLYLLELTDHSTRIDSFILSCRAMGRGIETAMMNHIKKRYLNDGTDGQLRGSYIPTTKNSPVQRFYEEQGFSVCESLASEEKNYMLKAHDKELLDCGWLAVEEAGADNGRRG
jgi:FkbH-like protein